jgi:hypothetical protein
MKDQSTEDALHVIETFDALPVERRLEIFRNLSPDAREQLTELVHRPQEIVRKISEEEMFFTIKAVGEDNAPGLIRSTTGKQLRYLLDLDLWKKEMFDTRSAAKWLEIISRMGEEKVLQLVQVADPELIVTVMNRLIKVVIRNPDIDLVEQHDTLPLFTLEDLFFIDFRFREYEEELKSFLETILRWNPEYYFGLMEELAEACNLRAKKQPRNGDKRDLRTKASPSLTRLSPFTNTCRVKPFPAPLRNVRPTMRAFPERPELFWDIR